MHSAGLELTKLIYTRLEDNLIRHRGDRYIPVSGMIYKYYRILAKHRCTTQLAKLSFNYLIGRTHI